MRYDQWNRGSGIPQRLWVAGAATLTILLLFFLVSKSSPVAGSLASNSASDALLLHDIQNATLGFQKIFAINLPSRTDHRDALSLAAALTNLTIDYVDGVTDVSERTLPPGQFPPDSKGQLGNWRAHLNAARLIVEQNISSALILEDDADWDIRIKDQMTNFARATRLLVQPLRQTSPGQWLDPTYPKTKAGDTPTNFYVADTLTTIPRTSPYGDLHLWDMLWIGHCGTHFPSQYGEIPLGRAVILDDVTVPETQHVEFQWGTKELVEQYPSHTRVVSRASENVCTLAYALSNSGARRLLYELGVRKLDSPTDVSMREVCDGLNDRPGSMCFTVQPQLFQHHRPVGSRGHNSDISPHGDEYNDKAYTRNIRWSTRLNFEKLLEQQTDYIDLFKDGEERPDIGF